MKVNDLELPHDLVALIKAGHWPGNPKAADCQNHLLVIPPAQIQKIASDETRIYLYAPPFFTVKTLRERGDRFWDLPLAAGDEISFGYAIPIGDFGMGSDAPILLDYRYSLSEPAVLRLKWGETGKNNHWVQVTANFQEFADLLGLQAVDFPPD